MNKKKFFDNIRGSLNLTTVNVEGLDKVLDYLERVEDNLQHAAYILATSWWETAQTMQPVREAYWKDEAWRKRNFRYYPYYGRGYVQLTWDYNYKKASDYFGVDFVKSPDLVMDPKYALPILVVGMNKGWFTGKDLDDYIDDVDESDTEELKEYKNARRIVNGTDKAETIAKLAITFEKGLKAGGYALKDTQKPVETAPVVPAPTVPVEDKPAVRPSVSLVEGIVALIKFLVSTLRR